MLPLLTGRCRFAFILPELPPGTVIAAGPITSSSPSGWVQPLLDVRHPIHSLQAVSDSSEKGHCSDLGSCSIIYRQVGS